ncbi:impB/MucB/SamB family protein [Clostridium sp. CAG:508]|jgi:DNA polymerase V|nr:impB/MucB/SamB family protein [Clostridium sp. CAG:508]
MHNEESKIYVAIDLKSFYASVECKERGLDPITTNLVVADSSRTEKTICLAVSPALKSYGIPGRARLFEVVQKVKEVNIYRKRKATNRTFTGSSYSDIELKKNKSLELSYIIAPPRMAYYMKYSSKIYNIYLKYFSSDDIYVYSIDEVFIDVTHYLKTYNMRAKELVTKVIQDVYQTTGITATAGIGTNLYLCKIAMDIVAKHVKPDENGVRIAGLDEMAYRKLLWGHRPLTDFWRVGKGYTKKLEEHGMYTMGDVARMSVKNEDLLYKLFGVNAELLIDHAWGWESVTIESIKAYRPATNSICSGQVLHCPYNYENTKIIVKEMTELLALDLVEKGLVTNQIVLEVGYDVDNLKNQAISSLYNGEITTDKYGRKVPKHAHGTINIDHQTASSKVLTGYIIKLYEQIVNKQLLVRRINITVNNVVNENMVKTSDYEQINLFVDYAEVNEKRKKEEAEKEIQKAMIGIKSKYGKNAILKGMNLQKEGTTIERNRQIGGHKE